jgi:peptidyl-prolyl cis-trans isomerase B (cyclophilin B)
VEFVSYSVFTIFDFMYKISICFVVSLILFSCSEEAPQQVKKEVIVEEVKTPIKEEPKRDLIADSNVVERLTKYGEENPETIVLITTTKGDIKIRLYKDTPLHRANFILMAKSGYYEGCLFSRVVKGFMAQCGGSYDEKQRNIKDTIGHYTIPAEMSKHHFHKKGAVAAARSYTDNPDKRSENDELYFVEGMQFSEFSLDKYADENKYTYSKRQRNYYLKNKGAAHLDGEHTVFGEIIKGLSVVSKLTDVKTDSQDWPNVDLYVEKVEVLK